MSEVLSILIVDDELLAHAVLEKYCKNIPYVKVIGNCYDGISTLDFLNEHKVDAILLDIQLPDITGMELLETLQQRSPKIIFTTAYSEYAIESFNFDEVIDYLNKPIRLPRFLRAMERLKHQLSLERAEQPTILETSMNEKALEYLMLKEDKTVFKVAVENIQYVQSWGNYLKVFLDGDQVRLVRDTMSEMESVLSPSGFVRIHKSYLINAASVDAIQGNQVVIADQKFPVGRSYRIEAMKVIQSL